MAQAVRTLIKSILTLICGWLSVLSLNASQFQTVNLAWDPSPDPAIAGYNIYCGPASGVYTNKISVGVVTNAAISNLVGNAIYFFVATAFDSSGLESDPSNEVGYSVPIIVPNQPPLISAISNQTILVSSYTPAIPFTVGDQETAASNLTLTAKSSNLSLLSTNNIVFGGSQSNRTVTLMPSTGQTGNVTITIYVADGTASNSAAFLLTVGSAPSPSLGLTLLTASSRLVRGSGLPGQVYRIQYANAVVGPWQNLGSATGDTFGVFQILDSNPPPTRFYRTVYP